MDQVPSVCSQQEVVTENKVSNKSYSETGNIHFKPGNFFSCKAYDFRDHQTRDKWQQILLNHPCKFQMCSMLLLLVAL
jgi:hypothetical protein